MAVICKLKQEAYARFLGENKVGKYFASDIENQEIVVHLSQDAVFILSNT